MPKIQYFKCSDEFLFKIVKSYNRTDERYSKVLNEIISRYRTLMVNEIEKYGIKHSKSAGDIVDGFFHKFDRYVLNNVPGVSLKTFLLREARSLAKSNFHFLKYGFAFTVIALAVFSTGLFLIFHAGNDCIPVTSADARRYDDLECSNMISSVVQEIQKNQDTNRTLSENKR